MKIKRRIISLLITAAILIGAVSYTSAASDDVSETSNKTGLLPIESNKASYSSGLEIVTFSMLPSAYDSSKLGYTLPVRVQHEDSCWAFGTLSTFETLLLKNGEEIETFGPQHANFWGSRRSDGTGWQREHTDGGYSYIPLGYLTSWSGPVNESDFPEETVDESFYTNFSKDPVYCLTEAIYFNSDTNRDTIKNLIFNFGAVVGNFNASTSYLSKGHSYYCANSDIPVSQLSGHCVSVVGWDDDYSKENFVGSVSGVPSSDGAWLIKNSWGEGNEYKGYYWISYEDVWMFDSIFGPSYALTNYEKLTDNKKLYQNEIDGATYEFAYLSYKNRDYNNVTYMNAFDFSEEHRTLSEVVFESTSVGSDFNIYYIPFEKDMPTSDTEQWLSLYSGEITYSGYICVDVPDTELPAGKGCIGININNKRVNTEYGDIRVENSIGVSEWLTSGSKLIYTPTAEYGLSYYMEMERKNPAVMDIMDFYFTKLDDEIGGTFVIKAITKNEEEATVPTEPSEITEPTTASDSTEPTLPSTGTNPSNPTDTTEATVPSDNTEPSSTTPTTIPTDKSEPSSSTTPTFPSDSPIKYSLGDANMDGSVNIKDATQIQKYAAGLIFLSDIEYIAADVTGNGDVNVIDSTNIQKHGAGLPVKFPIGQEQYHFD